MSTHPPPVDFIDPLELVDAQRYGRRGYPHDVWTELRARAPVAMTMTSTRRSTPSASTIPVGVTEATALGTSSTLGALSDR